MPGQSLEFGGTFTLLLVLAWVLTSWDSPLVLPLGGAFLAIGYLTTIGSALGDRAAIRRIVETARDQQLDQLQQQIQPYWSRYTQLTAQEAEQLRGLAEMHTLIRDAPPPRLRTPSGAPRRDCSCPPSCSPSRCSPRCRPNASLTPFSPSSRSTRQRPARTEAPTPATRFVSDVATGYGHGPRARRARNSLLPMGLGGAASPRLGLGSTLLGPVDREAGARDVEVDRRGGVAQVVR